MIRAAAAILCAVVTSLPAMAMVGGAQPTNEGAGRAVVMLTGSHGTFCSGVALARELVLTAAHCVLPGADYKLVDFDAARQVCELVGRKPHAPGRPSVPRPRYIDVWESEADWDRWARLP